MQDGPGSSGGDDRRRSGRPPHALVVGATGMLRGVALHLARGGWTVSALARGASGLDALRREAAAGTVVPLVVDYADDAALHGALATAVRERGPLDLVVAWLRPGAPRALDTIAGIADRAAGEAARGRCRLFRVLGSAAADPDLVRKGRGARYRAMEGLDYREIVLGFRMDGGRSRWNTNEEIAAGVIEAIERDLAEHVVGVVRPWAMNPRFSGAAGT